MANNYGLYFKREGEAPFRLPVNPEKLPVAREAENEEYNVLGIGPIMVPRTPKQREVTISSFFPGRPLSGMTADGEIQPPEFYINFFQSAMNDKAPITYIPVRFYEDGTPFATDDSGFDVLVTQFDTEERGGETGDFYFDLTLVEYRDYSPQTMQVKQEPAAPAKATTEPARQQPQGQIVVGSTCIANGKYYYTSYGDEPHGNGNGRRVKVSRIVDQTRAYPYHITTESGGALGWIKKEALQVVSST